MFSSECSYVLCCYAGWPHDSEVSGEGDAELWSRFSSSVVLGVQPSARVVARIEIHPNAVSHSLPAWMKFRIHVRCELFDISCDVTAAGRLMVWRKIVMRSKTCWKVARKIELAATCCCCFSSWVARDTHDLVTWPIRYCHVTHMIFSRYTQVILLSRDCNRTWFNCLL